MRNYKDNQFSINLMIMLRDERTLEECIEMKKSFTAEPELLDKDTMEIIMTELNIAIEQKSK